MEKIGKKVENGISTPKKTVTCKRCGYSWIPRKRHGLPRSCPRCRSYYWNRGRKC